MSYLSNLDIGIIIVGYGKHAITYRLQAELVAHKGCSLQPLWAVHKVCHAIELMHV